MELTNSMAYWEAKHPFTVIKWLHCPGMRVSMESFIQATYESAYQNLPRIVEAMVPHPYSWLRRTFKQTTSFDYQCKLSRRMSDFLKCRIQLPVFNHSYKAI